MSIFGWCGALGRKLGCCHCVILLFSKVWEMCSHIYVSQNVKPLLFILVTPHVKKEIRISLLSISWPHTEAQAVLIDLKNWVADSLPILFQPGTQQYSIIPVFEIPTLSSLCQRKWPSVWIQSDAPVRTNKKLFILFKCLINDWDNPFPSEESLHWQFKYILLAVCVCSHLDGDHFSLYLFFLWNVHVFLNCSKLALL